MSGRAEVAVTGVFGLIHGFGFAGTLRELALQGHQLVVPLLTFNLGLETAQLAALVLVIAPLLVLARSTTASRILAWLVGAVAVSWIVQRATGTANPLDPVLSVLLATPERLALLLGAAAVGVLVAPTMRSARGPQDEGVDTTAAASGSFDREEQLAAP